MKVRTGSGQIKEVYVQEDFEDTENELRTVRNRCLVIYYSLAFPEPRKDEIRKVMDQLSETLKKFIEFKESYHTKDKLFQVLPYLEAVED